MKALIDAVQQSLQECLDRNLAEGIKGWGLIIPES